MPRRGGRRVVGVLAALLLVSVVALGALVSAVLDQRGELTSAEANAHQARADADNAIDEVERLREQLAAAEAAAIQARQAADAAVEEAHAAVEQADAAVERAVAAEDSATAAEAAEARAAAEREAEQAREAAERSAAEVVAAGGSCDMGADGLPVCEHEPHDGVPDDWVPCGETGAYCPPDEDQDTAGKTPVWDGSELVEWLSDTEIEQRLAAGHLMCEPASYEDEDAGLECWYVD